MIIYLTVLNKLNYCQYHYYWYQRMSKTGSFTYDQNQK